MQCRDQQQRELRFEETAQGIEAFHGEKKVGAVELACEKNPQARPGVSKRRWKLVHIWVEENYRCAGIGAELLYQAKSSFQPLEIPGAEAGVKGEAVALADDYAGLLRRALRKGLLLLEWPREHDKAQRLRRGRGWIDR